MKYIDLYNNLSWHVTGEVQALKLKTTSLQTNNDVLMAELSELGAKHDLLNSNYIILDSEFRLLKSNYAILYNEYHLKLIELAEFSSSSFNTVVYVLIGVFLGIILSVCGYFYLHYNKKR